MNEIAKRQAGNLQKVINERGLYCAVREINTGALNSQTSGVYVMIGLDESSVNNYNRLDTTRFVEEYKQQLARTGIYSPKCQIVRITDSNNLEACADVLDMSILFEFLRDKSKDFGYKKMHTLISDPLIVLACTYYNESINPDRTDELREAAYEGCRQIFEYLNSDCKNMDEFYKKNKHYITKPSGKFKYETGTVWTSNSSYYRPLELLAAPTRPILKTPIEEKYLKEFESLMEQKKIEFYISPNPVIENDFGTTDLPEQKMFENGPKASVTHSVYYDAAYAGLVEGWTYAKNFKNLEKHAKSLELDTGDINNKYFFSVPSYWVNLFTNYLEECGSNYIFDIDGVYIPSTRSTFGIVVDNNTDMEHVKNAFKYSIEQKSSFHVIDKLAERAYLSKNPIERRNALKELEDRNNGNITPQISNEQYER